MSRKSANMRGPEYRPGFFLVRRGKIPDDLRRLSNKLIEELKPMIDRMKGDND